MKKLFVLLLALLLLPGCSLSRELSYLDTPSVALLPCNPLAEVPLPDSSQLKSALQGKDLTVTEYNEGALSDRLASALEAGCNAFVVGLSTTSEAGIVLDSLTPEGLPVLFYGAAPEAALLQSYDKAWYLGGNTEKQGELLGEALVADYKAGRIPDINGDNLLQYAVLDLDTEIDLRTKATLRIFENYGIFSNELIFSQSARDEAAAYEAAVQMLEREGGSIELLLAATPELCAGAARAIQDAGAAIPLATYGSSDAVLSLIEENRLLATSRYDTETAAELLAALTYNAATKKPILDGLAVPLDGSTLTVGFSLLAPQATPTASSVAE